MNECPEMKSPIAVDTAEILNMLFARPEMLMLSYKKL